MSVSVLCIWCGNQMEVGDDLAGAAVACPKCKTICGVPPSPRKKSPVKAKPSGQIAPPKTVIAAVEERVVAKAAAPPAPKPAVADADSGDDDDKPYVVSKLGPSCPQCDAELSENGEICPKCR